MEKLVTFSKMGHTVRSPSPWAPGSHVEKWVTRRKMGGTWKNGLHLEKWVTLEKIGQS